MNLIEARKNGFALNTLKYMIEKNVNSTNLS